MEHIAPFRLKVHGFGRSVRSFLYLCIAYPMLHLLAAILTIPLFHFFPQLHQYADWISLWVIVPMTLLLLLIAGEALSWVVITDEEITLYWLGIPLRRIARSDLAIFAAVSDDVDDALCFTSYSTEKMAAMQEKRMLKGFFTQHDVPFRKRHSDWQDSFAKDFLNHQKKSIRGLFRDKHVIMTDFTPELVHILRSLYPSLTYRNYMGISPSYTMQTSLGMEDVVPCLKPELNLTKFTLQEDGIHLFRGKNEISCLRAQDIRTIAVVDAFRPYSKTTPYRLRLLLVTSLSEAELADRAPKRLFGMDTDILPDDTRLLALNAAAQECALWTIRHTDFCPICCTAKNLSSLKALYPDTQWIDLSDSWLKNN